MDAVYELCVYIMRGYPGVRGGMEELGSGGIYGCCRVAYCVCTSLSNFLYHSIHLSEHTALPSLRHMAILLIHL